jgi:hypothetical protein
MSIVSSSVRYIGTHKSHIASVRLNLIIDSGLWAVGKVLVMPSSFPPGDTDTRSTLFSSVMGAERVGTGLPG